MNEQAESNTQIKVKKNVQNKSRLSLIVFVTIILPFFFNVFNQTDSFFLKTGLPLLYILTLFCFVLFYSVKLENYSLLLGVILIIPILGCVSFAFSDFYYYSGRIGIAKFDPVLSPSTIFYLGTDYEGRDILSTLIIGGMHAYIIAIISMLIALIVGVPAGLLLTSKNRVLNGIANIITQFFEIVPQIFFVLIVLGVFNFWAAQSAGERLVSVYSVPITAFAIGISSLPSISRLVETRVNLLLNQRFVTALRSANVSEIKILLYNILWNNCITEIMIQATFIFGSTILIESALGYAFEIGFGDLGTGGYLSWGKILAEARRSILFAENIWIVLFPIIIIIVSILGVNILGDRLAEFLRKES